jgi:triphosphoribosyl-dephospho-CoA synthetase
MARLTDDDIAEALGTPKPDKPAPANRVEDTMQALEAHDAKVSKLVEAHRKPDESHEQAHARLMQENPSLYAADKAQRGRILRSKGVGADASTGGL